jgi:LysR family cys regulon transcriptional activator
MNLQQLPYLCAIADHGLDLSKAAAALFTSQPGISNQIRLLEEELGAPLLVRQGSRITGLTEPGRDVLESARRVLREIENARRAAADLKAEETGSLMVATTHAHARYLLLPVVQRSQQRFPELRLMLRQGTPDQVVQASAAGQVDLGLCTAPSTPLRGVVSLPCYRVSRCVVVPAGHVLLRKKRPTLADLAAYPMIMLDPAFSTGVSVQAAFQEQGIEPNVVMTATDADVVKAYVAAGCGIATLPELAFEPRRDKGLRMIAARHLFAPSLTSIWIRRGRYLRRFAFDFIHMLSPA